MSLSVVMVRTIARLTQHDLGQSGTDDGRMTMTVDDQSGSALQHTNRAMHGSRTMRAWPWWRCRAWL